MTTTAVVKTDGGTGAGNAVKGARSLAFISTLDSVSCAPIIERGWKRSAFAFELSFQPSLQWVLLFAFSCFAHEPRTRSTCFQSPSVVPPTMYSITPSDHDCSCKLPPC